MDPRINYSEFFRDFVEISNASIMSIEYGQHLDNLFEQMCPKTSWGRVNWSRFYKKTEPSFDYSTLIPNLLLLFGHEFDRNVYVSWSTYAPVIKTTLDNIIKYEDYFDAAVPFEKFIFNPTANYVIEIKSSMEVTAGIPPISHKFFQAETYIDPKILDHNSLFKKCIDTLNVTLLPPEEEKQLDVWFKNNIPITRWGRIDWEFFKDNDVIGASPKSIRSKVSKLFDLRGPLTNTTAYIEWSTIGIPIIKTNLETIARHFDVIASVSFEKFIFNPDIGYVAEICDTEDTIIARIPKKECLYGL
ncbi:MAG TPA: hypothetical protein VGT41_01170 [Candidatus Babeliales bacterium]|nr:hypothetical protein [Candidatus Babeliales bacterium]